MPGPFFQRLREYYNKVAQVLRGEAQAASVFPNPTDIGMSREKIYAEFLRQHAPSKCNIFFGGFVFDDNGQESAQLDVIVTTDTTPNFNFHNRDGHGKSFSHIEGTLSVASIKSMLNKNELEDALKGIATIPKTSPLEDRLSFGLTLHDYDDWPYKIIYASDGIAGDTLLKHLNDFYINNPQIPISRRPNIIHVSGKYVIFRAIAGMSMINKNTNEIKVLEVGNFSLFTTNPDIQGIVWVLDDLQKKATASTHILFEYGQLINCINDITL